MKLKGSDDCGVSLTCYDLAKCFTTTMVVAMPFTCNVVVTYGTRMAFNCLSSVNACSIYPLQTKVSHHHLIQKRHHIIIPLIMLKLTISIKQPMINMIIHIINDIFHQRMCHHFDEYFSDQRYVVE